MIGQFFLLDGKVYPQGQAVITPENRSFRYGDGLFETMRWENGKINHDAYHMDRLFQGLSLLEFELPALFGEGLVREEIHRLVLKNRHNPRARVRLNVFRGNEGILENADLRPHYLIESWDLPGEDQLNPNGLDIDIYPDMPKSGDRFSNLKSNNFLPYVMAGIYAKKHRLNDALLLNTSGHIADSVIANVFVVKSGRIYTPPLSEGPVAGVVRRWMLEKFSVQGIPVSEKVVTESDLLEADEIFLTNSIRLLRWVGRFRHKTYGNTLSREIYAHLLSTI
ncbi:MAG: aminotransferase class IV [Bacteroidota bacterium]|nr:aminotransferase class IV [Bacteroidota bacterium]